MTSPETALPTAPSHPPGTGPLLLVLSPSAAHVDEARRIAAAWPQPGRVVTTTDPTQALSLVMSGAPALAIVEAGLDAGTGRAMAQQIARWQPGLDVLSFAEQAGDPRVLPWSELRTVLDWWWQNCRPAPILTHDGNQP